MSRPMNARRGRLVALGTAIVGVGVVIGSSFLLRTRLLEEWYFWKAVNGTEGEQAAAVEKLGRMEAVDGLLRVMRQTAENRPCATVDGNIRVQLSRIGTLAQGEIQKLGAAATRALVREMTFDKWRCSFFAAYTLEQVTTGGRTQFRLDATDEAKYVALVLRDLKSGKLRMPEATLSEDSQLMKLHTSLLSLWEVGSADPESSDIKLTEMLKKIEAGVDAAAGAEEMRW